MSCRLSELVLKSHDVGTLSSRFWCEVLGYVELDRDGGAIEIGPASGFGGPVPTIVIVPASGEKHEPLRLHFDVNPVDRDQDAELERLLALSARRADVGQAADESWHVLADPEGNEFCLLKSQLPEI